MNREIIGDWRTSSFSGANGNCVEVAPTDGGGTAMRDSKDRDGAVLFFTKAEMDAFLAGAKAGEFDN